jgi:molybdopterin-guanine dinucleotide biosynthesis protein A
MFAVRMDGLGIWTRRVEVFARTRRLACENFERWNSSEREGLACRKKAGEYDVNSTRDDSSPLTFTAVLVVGGESRRMGADKATLIFEGEPLWSRQLKLLRALQPEKCFVSARVRPEWRPSGVDVVLDEEPSRGPLSGLLATLRKAQTTHLLALAIDLPRMNLSQLKQIVQRARQNCGVVPVSGGGFEPLCAVYPVTESVIAAANKALMTNDVSLENFVRHLLEQSWLREFKIQPVDRQLYFNANTPEEFSKAAF